MNKLPPKKCLKFISLWKLTFPFLLLLVWLSFVFGLTLIGSRGTLPNNADSVMYSLPLADDDPSLGLPLIGDFPPYSSSWGHHWPGAMMVKQVIFWILPYSRFSEILIASLMLLSTSVIILKILRAHGAGWIISSAFASLIILDPMVWNGIWYGGRFEAYCSFAISVFLYAVSCPRVIPKPVHAVIVGAASAFAVMSHPYSMVAAGLFGVAGILYSRTAAPYQHWAFLSWLGGGIIGAALLLLYFFFFPEARDQIVENLALQKSFLPDASPIWIQFGSSRYPLGSGYVFLLMSAISAVAGVGLGIRSLNRGIANNHDFPFIASALTVAVVLGIYVFSKTLNDSHLVSLRCAFVLVGGFATVRLAGLCGTPIKNLAALPVIFVLSNFAFFQASKFAEWAKIGFPNVPAEVRVAILETRKNRDNVTISYDFWSSLSEDEFDQTRLWTFAVASNISTRLKYEKMHYSKLREGDIVIYDPKHFSGSDPFGLGPTFLKTGFNEPYWKTKIIHNREVVGAGKATLTIAVATLQDERWKDTLGNP